MIKKVRVDFRLIHGQVLYSWVKAVDSNNIIIIDDELVNNEVKKRMMRLCVSPFIKYEIYSVKDGIEVLKNTNADKNKRYLVLTSDIISALSVCNELELSSFNIGETVYSVSKQKIAKSVYITEEEKIEMNNYIKNGNTIEIQQVWNSKKLVYNNKKFII